MHIHTTESTLRFGAAPAQARGAVILLHGRGSSAHDIAGLAKALKSEALTFAAPSATDGTWYPQRFLSPLQQNEPWLSGALSVIDQLVVEFRAAGIPDGRIALAGFSQGACLALEYAARNPQRYGFVAGLSGALIGPLASARASFDLKGTPVLLGCAEADAHIPLEHVEQSAVTLSAAGGDVTKQIFRGSAHTVFPEEIAWLRHQVATWK